MSDRTAAFALGILTFGALLIFVNGLAIAADETWPGHPSLTAARELITGAAGT